MDLTDLSALAKIGSVIAIGLLRLCFRSGLEQEAFNRQVHLVRESAAENYRGIRRRMIWDTSA